VKEDLAADDRMEEEEMWVKEDLADDKFPGVWPSLHSHRVVLLLPSFPPPPSPNLYFLSSAACHAMCSPTKVWMKK
jgi:hypothetical protein